MGILDKVKNMFTEEIEETPIKKEVMQVEIPSPAPTSIVSKKEEERPKISESEVLVKEEKPSAPVFFDDKDFANLERVEKREEKKVKKLEDKYKGKEEEKKAFKPTPIISPVYGVLDKNYHKEDITPKKTVSISTYSNKESLTIDDVRRKAYGTLEDDLEVVVPSDDYEIFEENNMIIEEKEESQIMDDLMDIDYQPRFAKRNEPSDILDMMQEDNNFKAEDELQFETTDEQDNTNADMFEELHEDVQSEDELTDSDLFNLIDSMYDKEDDK